ncbi:MAG: glucosidase, partial [Ferruginibacter sp.]|nr:glucosidase [Cytophagales bacterium]
AKADAEDILVRLTVHNRAREAAHLHVLPQAWFRNTWSWGQPDFPYRPFLHRVDAGTVGINHPSVSMCRLFCDGQPELLFCDNESNVGHPPDQQADGYFKDGIHAYVVDGVTGAVNPRGKGTKVAVRYGLTLPAGASETIRLRLTRNEEGDAERAFSDFDALFAQRQREADAFYAEVQSKIASEDARNVQRQAFAGMLWSKQFYHYYVPQWLRGDPTQPTPDGQRKKSRNRGWTHLRNAHVISMPDKWEYPWYAAWDLAFHCIPLVMIDPEFAKEQLLLLTREEYMHPNGQLPAYEWNFSDVNPPVHAWAAWRVYTMDKEKNGGNGDRPFLETVFHKLLLNFTWWVNRHDHNGSNVFQGGFLGLDNIGVFDRSAKLPTGGHLEQADGTSWMAMYTLNLMRIAVELAQENRVYEEMAGKFFEHFLLIARAMTNLGDEGIHMWDEEDQFFYDVLQTPQEERIRLKVRSLVGLVPLFAVEVIENSVIQSLDNFSHRLKWFLYNRPDLVKEVASWQLSDESTRLLFSPLRVPRLRRLLKRMLDETEFLSEYGIRSLSRVHRDHPFVLDVDGNPLTVKYVPAESDSDMFGGNSNWRGPIWFPINYLIILSLERYHRFYGKTFTMECPTGSGNYLDLKEIAAELSRRLCRLYLRDGNGERTVYTGSEKFQRDPHFRDYLLFHEYFDGDTGRGIGASHQTGWTGLIADLLNR